MRFKIIFNLLKLTIGSKMVRGYLVTIIIILMTLAFVNFTPEHSVPDFVRAILFFSSAAIIILGIGKSSLIPDGTSSNKEGKNQTFSANYLLSTVRYIKEYFVSFYAEILLDGLFLSLYFISCFYLSVSESQLPTLVQVLIFFTLGAFFTFRTVKLSGAISRYARRTDVGKNRYRTHLKWAAFFIVTLTLLTVNCFYKIVTPDMIALILRPLLFSLIIFLPYSLYKQFTTNYNREEDIQLRFKYYALAGVLVLTGYGWFYLEEIKTGNIIFDLIKHNNKEKVEKLIKANSGIMLIANDESLNPLQYATDRNREEIVKLLIENGSDINVLDQKKKNLLFIVAENCNLTLTEYLISKGININQLNEAGENAIFAAANSGCLPLILYFKKQNMPLIKNKEGKTYLESGMKKNKNFEERIKFFQRNGINAF